MGVNSTEIWQGIMGKVTRLNRAGEGGGLKCPCEASLQGEGETEAETQRGNDKDRPLAMLGSVGSGGWKAPRAYGGSAPPSPRTPILYCCPGQWQVVTVLGFYPCPSGSCHAAVESGRLQASWALCSTHTLRPWDPTKRNSPEVCY